MNLPLNPTEEDRPAGDLVAALPTDTARRRVLAAAGVDLPPDGPHLRERIAELPPATRRRLRHQIRFAGRRTVYYARVPGLSAAAFDTPDDTADDTATAAFGGHVETTLTEGNQLYVVCSVPETGTQTQLGGSNANRLITVATCRTDTDLVGIRAPDRDTADATRRTLTRAADADEHTTVEFTADGVRNQLRTTCVDGYTEVVFRTTRTETDADRIVVRASGEGDAAPDVLDDTVTALLEDQPGTELVSGRARLSVAPEGSDEPLQAQIRFRESAILFGQFLPEATLLAVDDLLRDTLA